MNLKLEHSNDNGSVVYLPGAAKLQRKSVAQRCVDVRDAVDSLKQHGGLDLTRTILKDELDTLRIEQRNRQTDASPLGAKAS